MKKWIALAIVALILVAGVQWLVGALRREDFRQELHIIAEGVSEGNDDDIKKRVVEAAHKIKAEIRKEDIQVQYAPTQDLSFAQRTVGMIASFENYRATITAEFRQSICLIPVTQHIEANALIQSAAKAKP